MSTPRNPFAKSTAIPGKGEIEINLLPPNKQVLKTFNYQYPLKLISPDPHTVTVTSPTDEEPKQHPITTIFLLTYGGGLLAGDSINLTITCNPHTRLALLTQGSTKIFKTSPTGTTNNKSKSTTNASPTILQTQITQSNPTSQTLNVLLHPHSTLCYLPDPNQPHKDSTYTQRQTIYIDPHGSSSLLFLDWVSEGRTHRGESWSLTSWQGRNEIREYDPHSAGRLLIRDALLLNRDNLRLKTDGKGILGTLIIYGPVWKQLAEYFVKEFRGLPRLGGKSWTPGAKSIAEEGNDYFDAGSKVRRREQEAEDGLVWTAAQARGFVLVKFGSREVEGSRRWLGGMLRREGSVQREMGHQGLFCVS